MKRLNRVIEGLTLIFVGFMFLANSAGVLTWRVWITVFSLWPLLLIAVGVDIVGKGTRQSWIRVLSSLIVAGGLAYAVFVAPSGPVRWSLGLSADSQQFELVEPRDSRAQEAELSISIPVARLDVEDGRDLLSASGRAPFDPRLETRRVGDAYEFTLDGNDGNVVVLDGEPWADVQLGRDVEWALLVDTGFADSRLDLSKLDLSRVDIEAGVALVDMTLGEPVGTRDVPVEIDSGISNVVVRIPEGVEASVRSEIGLGRVNVDIGGTRNGIWKTDGYDEADHRFAIVLKGGIGSVDVLRD